jgi:hypothetical protein
LSAALIKAIVEADIEEAGRHRPDA